MKNKEREKNNAPVEIADDMLTQVSGGTDIVPVGNVSGEVQIPALITEQPLPVGAIMEA